MGTIALIVEEPARHESVGRTMSRICQYLNSGVPMVWLLVPEDRCVIVCRRGQEFRLVEEDEELARPDDGPGLGCRVAEFFDMPGQ